MITIKNNVFHLATPGSSYVFFIDEAGLPEHLYYGKRLKNPEDNLEALRSKHLTSRVSETSLDGKHVTLQPHTMSLEFSTEGAGDYRTPLVSASYGELGERALDLRYKGYKSYSGISRMNSLLPQALGKSGESVGIEVEFSDEVAEVSLSLFYTIFSDSDVIIRRSVVKNLSKASTLSLDALFSAALDFDTADFTLSTFDGAWGRERYENQRKLTSGKFVNESRRGASSADHNPGIILTSDAGAQYALNLIYSGSHQECVEVNGYGRTHILTGINPDQFSTLLKPSASFESPEAVLLYAESRGELSAKLALFVRQHIQRGFWKDRQRPIAFHTWDSCGYNLSENRILSLVKEASSLGFELFVVDDGWFGARSNQESSLGDWSVNTLKIPEGLAALSKTVHQSGMLFGLWIEPEAISRQSRLFDKHPNWLLGNPKRKNTSVCKNQYLLDLTNAEVQEYLINTIKNLVRTSELNYLKWDMNRHLSEVYDIEGDEGDYLHRYVMALYKIQKAVTSAIPNLILESGSARFDLGMAAYATDLTLSECTDPFERIPILEGTLALYPLSIISNTITGEKNAATLRRADLSSRFESALFGALSYSLDLTRLSKAEKNGIASQIEFYKQYRKILQFGSFLSEQSGEHTVWSVAAPDKSVILILYAQKLLHVNEPSEILRITQADENAVYRIVRRADFEEPIWDVGSDVKQFRKEEEAYVVSGDILKYAGLRLATKYSGSPYASGMRVMPDFSTRLYIAKKINKEGN